MIGRPAINFMFKLFVNICNYELLNKALLAFFFFFFFGISKKSLIQQFIENQKSKVV
jgi:phosphatidylglycerophosphatase A